MKARIEIYLDSRYIFGREVDEPVDNIPLPSFFFQEIADVFYKHDIEIVGFKVKKLKYNCNNGKGDEKEMKRR